MPLVALENGKRVFAWEVKERAPLYTCKGCDGRLVFMDCVEKIKYFRHYEHCECDSEPETDIHVWGKETVFKAIQERQDGSFSDLEYRIGNLKADVYWKNDLKEVAIEVQAANYPIGVFKEKIHEYDKRGLLTVYLFVGDNFLKKTRTNVYSLKEIEKQLFVDREIPGQIKAGYLLKSGKVFIPDFQAKFARGDGYCSHRFISSRHFEKTVTLKQFLIDVACTRFSKSKCTHSRTKHVANFEKIKRYKVVCSYCDKFMKWLPNEEALKLGYSLE